MSYSSGSIVRLRLVLLFAAFVGCNSACPSVVGGACDPRDANCPAGYYCAMAEVCTRRCDASVDCWIKTSDGCRSNMLPGQRLPDGGVFVEVSDDGYCTESKAMACVEGYCQREACGDGGCEYDLYGPSPFKGNRGQGPAQ